MAKVYVGVGHGGSDPGAVSGKHRESSYALDIADACTAELKLYGVAAMQSRTSDVTESAAAKIKECNEYAPDAALDIHLNSGGGDGFEIYHSITGGEGIKLAQSIEEAVIAAGQNSRGLKTRKNSSGKDYFGFIRQTGCPAVLIECAFIDSGDVKVIDTRAERQAMGRAIAHGILEHLGIAVSNTAANSTDSASAAAVQESVSVALPLLRRNVDAPDYQVKRVQLCLNQMGHTGADGKPLTVDGDFGANTEAAIRKLQQAHSITADGTMSAMTWRALLVYKK